MTIWQGKQEYKTLDGHCYNFIDASYMKSKIRELSSWLVDQGVVHIEMYKLEIHVKHRLAWQDS